MTRRKKTIVWSELRRLSFCNSSTLPKKVNFPDGLREWVGIGWLPIGPINKRYITVVEDPPVGQKAAKGRKNPERGKVPRKGTANDKVRPVPKGKRQTQ